MNEAVSPRRLVLMDIATIEDERAVRRAHESFVDIPGVTCLTAVGPTAAVGVAGSPYSHASVFEFDDRAARAAYHVHPIHEGARDEVRAHLTSVLVLDLD